MRVGLLTSWRVPCGIYQYTARLADAIAQIPDVEPVILAGRADEHRSVPEESQHEVHNVAKIGLWRDDGVYDIDMEAVGNAEPLDVLHVQYQSMLFNQPHLQVLAQWRRDHGPVAITFHDNCQRPDFPYGDFDLHFSHRWNVGPPTVDVIPFGIEDRPPVIRTFGLGRSRTDLIAPICQRHGWILESAASHEPIQGGGQAWKPHEALIQWLRGADAIVLWYDDVQAAGSSQAARTAIATRRPVFTNDTKWFEDLPTLVRDSKHRYFQKVPDLEQLEHELSLLFERPYVKEHSWSAVAQAHLDHYARVKARA